MKALSHLKRGSVAFAIAGLLLAGCGATASHTAAGNAPVVLLRTQARAAFVSWLKNGNASMSRASTRVGSNGAAESFNWGGYAKVSGNVVAPSLEYYTAVHADWTVPAVTCPARSAPGVGSEDLIVADWVGIDGVNDQTVEQLGTSSQCYDGVAEYYDWWEMYPGGSAEVSFVFPGDQVRASVRLSLLSDTYRLTLVDLTNPESSFTTDQACDVEDGVVCINTSAEVIVERPAYQVGITPLADYGSTTFSGVSFSAGLCTQRSLCGSHLYSVYTLDATSNYLLASVSPLINGSFTSTWHDSY